MTDPGHDAAEGAHRGEDPADPDAPKDVKQEEMMRRPGNPHEALGRIGVDHSRACAHRGLGDGVLQFARQGRLGQDQGAKGPGATIRTASPVMIN